jgi:hypothetical protein
MAEIRNTLGKQMRGRRDPDANASRAKYKVIGSPRLSALDKQLRIYRLREKYATTTNVEIAYEVGILKAAHTNFNPDTVIAQVSTYYKEACNIAENLITGCFPDDTKSLKNNDLFG